MFFINKKNNQRAFTLVEIAVVILIIGLVYSLVFTRSSYANYFKQEGFLREFTETISFLHQRATIDGKGYKLEINFADTVGTQETEYWYRVREMPDPIANRKNQANNLNPISGVGRLSEEIAVRIASDIDLNSQGRAPINFPSLKDKVRLPDNLRIVDIRLKDGLITQHTSENIPAIFFSPQGFSDFAVIHFENEEKGIITVLVNPFSGLCKIYKEFKDFEWTFGRQDNA